MALRTLFGILLLFSLSINTPILAESKTNKKNDDSKATKKEGEEDKKSKEDDSVTEHSITLAGIKQDFTVTSGKLPLLDSKGNELATVFYTSYIKKEENKAKRPITFCFNGGPGSSSIWLHMGLTGLKRVPMPKNAQTPKPPYHLIENQSTILDLTDVVMIDPVSTGFSQPADPKKKSNFHGYNEDIKSVGNFIERFITQNNRWASPKYLLGESYGTMRAAGLSGYLQGNHGMYINGIVMISSVLDYRTLSPGNGNDLGYVMYLPTYTASAFYHKQLSEELQVDLEKTLEQAKSFAINEYYPALLRGDHLDATTQASIAKKMSRLTGLSEQFLINNRLRIHMGQFAKELLRKKGHTIGRFDSRFKGTDKSNGGDSYDYDPSGAAMTGAYTALFNQYLRNDLKYESKSKYYVFGSVRPWNYSSFTNKYVNSSETLRSAMAKNQNLKVFVASGYYDLATPYFASDYTYGHLGLNKELQKNIFMKYYTAGHMMYLHEPSLLKLKKDLASFYAIASPVEQEKISEKTTEKPASEAK